jgi:hydrogenase nickel incorporation protein HypA/HybF
MHEVGLARQLLDIAESAAKEHGATAITKVGLRLGAMAGVVPDALSFAFEVARQGTMAEQAVLEVEYLPLVCYCESCRAAFEVDDRFGIALCPQCGEPSAEIRQGTEFTVSYLEVT